MIKILVPLCIDKRGANGRHFVYGAYLKKLISHNLLPVFISPLMSEQMLQAIVAEARGLLLCGGVDVDPARYGAERHPLTEPSIPDRDMIEFDMVARFYAARKPIFGICRGCQLLAVNSGGTLHQHVPDLKHSDAHGDSEVKTADDLARAPRHDLIVDPSSLCYSILKKERISVNSAHHQGVATVGSSLRAAARTADGLIEIVESTNPDHFVIAVQPHPEEDAQGTLDPLIAAFAQEVAEAN